MIKFAPFVDFESSLFVNSFLSKLTRRASSVVFTVAVLLCCAASALSIPLAQYRKQVGTTKSLIGSLAPINERMSGGELLAAERATLQDVRKALKSRESIEFNGATFEADNSWLEKSLQAYEKDGATGAERASLRRQMSERLAALDVRLAEMENAVAATRGKNEDKQKLDEILRRPEFQNPNEREKSILEQWMNALRKWWRDLFARNIEPQIPNAPSPQGFSVIASILQYVVIFLAVAVIGFVIWRFVIPLLRRDRKVKKRRKNEPRIVLGETLAADETADNLLSEAERLALSGDVRAAIRKGYIALLCELSDRKVLGLARHKTNRDYLRDVRPKDEIFQPMQNMTGSFEQHWYGATPANEIDWREFRGNYEQALNRK